MAKDSQLEQFRAELSQPSGVSQLECTAESKAVARATLLKEALTAIQTNNAHTVRITFENDFGLWMSGDEILNKLLTTMAYEN